MMEAPLPTPLPRRQTTTELVLVCLAGAAMFMPGLWNRDLWHPLEPGYAQTASEMVKSGNWVALTRNGKPYYNKPPLFFWLEALGVKAFGLRTAAVRLPAVVLGIGTLVLTYLIAGCFRIDPLASSLVLATAWRYGLSCQRVSIDITLCFLVLLAFYLYLRSIEPGGHGWPYAAGAAVAAALGVLAKGPVALLWLACAIFPYLIWRRKWREVFHWKWCVGVLIVASIAISWLLIVGHHEGSGFYKVILGRELAKRFDPDAEEAAGPLFYVIRFPTSFLPWFLYFPFAVALAWKRRNEPSFQALLWFAASFVGFSLVPVKMSRYIVPLLPAGALLVGAYLTGRDSRAGLVALWGYAAGAVALMVGTIFVEPAALGYSLALGIPALACSIAGLLLWPRLGFKALMIVAMVVFLLYSLTIIPYRNRTKSPRPLAEFLNSQGAAQDDVVWVRSYQAGVAFYGGYTSMRRVDKLDSLNDYAHAYVIATSDYVRDHPAAFGSVQPLRTFSMDSNVYLVFKTP
jgi:4-amino-4-deoxy-L-arabinose transferase-like glycosyltransferase